MKNDGLQFLSIVISSLALLYILFVNVFRESFIVNDWIVVSVDLIAKIIIEMVLLSRK